MKKHSKMMGAAGLLAVIALTGCAKEEPLTYEETSTPVTEFHESQKDASFEELETGWVKKDNSIVVSLSGPENCPPAIEKISKKSGTVSIYLKDSGDDCSPTVTVRYTTISDAADTKKVEVYEAGYNYPFELHEQQ